MRDVRTGAEPLVVDLLEFTVLAQLRERRVELQAQIVVLFAHGDRHTLAQRLAVLARVRRTDQAKALRIFRLREKARIDLRLIRKVQIGAARSEIEIRLAARLVALDRRHIAETLRDEVVHRRARLHGDRLALQSLGCDRQMFALRADEAIDRKFIDVGERHHALAFLGDIERRDQRVVFLAEQTGEHAAPRRVDDVAFHLHAIAERVNQVDVVAGEAAVGRDGFERREGGVGGDIHLGPFFRVCERRTKSGAGGGNQQKAGVAFHRRSREVACWMDFGAAHQGAPRRYWRANGIDLVSGFSLESGVNYCGA
ncbi:hypothetical protein PT2222_110096 [Paraburkholderia tropica]